jgi:hypothetical protein
MARKSKKSIEIEQNKTQVLPLLSDIFAVFSEKNIVMIDFGFTAPSYFEPHKMQDTQIARICLSWELAQKLSDVLQNTILEHKEEQKVKSKAKRGSGK